MHYLSSVCLFVFLANGLFSCSATRMERVMHSGEMWFKYGVDKYNNPILFKAFQMEDTDFTAAHRNCRKFSSHLASFHSIQEFYFIIKVLLEQFGDSFAESTWLGLYHKHESLDGLPNFQLYFTDGSKYDLETDEKTHATIWNKLDEEHSYEPNGLGSPGTVDTEYCAELVSSSLQSGDLKYRLNDMYCHNSAPVHVCRYSESTAEFDDELPSEVINGDISPQTRSDAARAVPTTPPPPPPSFTTTKAAVQSPTPKGLPATLRKSEDTFYFVLFLLAFLFLMLETGYIYWLHYKNPGINSFSFKNF